MYKFRSFVKKTKGLVSILGTLISLGTGFAVHPSLYKHGTKTDNENCQ